MNSRINVTVYNLIAISDLAYYVAIAQLEERSAANERLDDCLVHES